MQNIDNDINEPRTLHVYFHDKSLIEDLSL